MDTIKCCDDWSSMLKSILFTEEEIYCKIDELAKQLSEKYAGKEVLCVGLMNGCVMFLTHLLKKVTFKYKLDTMVVSSYGHSTETSGTIRIKKDLNIDPAGRDVLIIEDLIDTGTTLDWVKRYLESKKCNSITLCCLLDKKERRLVHVDVDYVGFACPNEFVVGFGMDYQDEYRCLPFIGCIDITKI